jgi:hypothetical protein
MKAIARCGYGSPACCPLQDIHTPAPGDNDVLVKARSSVNGPIRGRGAAPAKCRPSRR